MKIKIVEDKQDDRVVLNETSLSRLNSFTDKYQVAFVTAFKSPAWIRDEYETDKRSTPREVLAINRDRNSELLRDIKGLGYNSFKVDGRYENKERKARTADLDDKSSYTDKEESFGIINPDSSEKGKGVFLQNVKDLGNKYNQESILVVDAQTKQGTFYYLDSSGTPGTEEDAGKVHFGKDSPFKSLVNGRPMYVESVSKLYDRHTNRFH